MSQCGLEDRYDSRMTVLEAPQTLDEVENRAETDRAWSQSLAPSTPISSPPFVRFLREALAADICREEREHRLQAAQTWLRAQLEDWLEDGPVYDDEALRFNRALDSTADALRLALEVVSLIRFGNQSLALAMLEQVETFLQQSLGDLRDIEPSTRSTTDPQPHR